MKKSLPITFSNAYRIHTVIDDFLKAFYSQQLNYMASDLLENGYSPEDILTALDRAMTICKNADMQVDCHFMPLYSDRNGVTIRDCKLSRFGYQLLVLNANPEHPATARFQKQVLERADPPARFRKKYHDSYL